MKAKREIIKDSNTEIIFEFKKEKFSPAWLDNNEIFYILTVVVKVDGKEMATYQREFSNKRAGRNRKAYEYYHM